MVLTIILPRYLAFLKEKGLIKLQKDKLRTTERGKLFIERFERPQSLE